MQNNILPVFKTNASIGRSILTYEDETEIKEEYPISVIAIAKKHNLDKLVVIEDSFLSFPKLYKNCNKNNIQLIFGINFTICNDIKDKNENSLYTESKISILIKNSNGYKDLIKLHDAINSNIDNFYYIPRGDFNILKEYWTENLELIIPPFDGFIHKNFLENGRCMPNFTNIKPILTYANTELPWNNILNKKIINFGKNNNYQLQEIHPIFYYKKSDFKAYMTFRCINNRSKFSKPELNYFSSDCFCFEEFLNKTGGQNK